MTKVGELERVTQDKVIAFLRDELGYEFLGDWHERDNSNIEVDYLRPYLESRLYPTILIDKAISQLRDRANNTSHGLYYANKAVYQLLKYGCKVKENVGDNNQTVNFIDWETFHNNHFAFAEEVTVIGDNTKRPDIVFYINGIALGTLELKRSGVCVENGIRQNLDNQKAVFIMPFFSTVQLVMAGNETQGLRYGVIDTKQKYYLEWKRDGNDEKLYKHLKEIWKKERILEIIHDFIIFDAGVKKICRHSQYYALQAAQERIHKRESGIIWHSQGSGKSIIMIFLAKWILLNIENSRVLIITDRTELDEQIERNFHNADEELVRTKSGKDMLEMLNKATPSTICSLIHKFGVKDDSEDKATKEFIEDLMANQADFSPKGDIYVFVDECHRTQSGELHKAMRLVLPNSMYIGFTGTPLLQEDKKTSIEAFGSYIHTYKFNEAVEDGVILDLRYEARDIDQRISNQTKIDQWFEAHTKGLTDNAKGQLKARWGTLQRVLSSQSRLEKIVFDILFDFDTKDRLSSGTGTAMLVSGSIYQACKLYELFLSKGFEKCAVITSYVPHISDTKGETTGEGSPTERLLKYEVYKKMLNGKNVEDFEKEAKRQFIHEPGQMKLLIVVDKLLTGFDAPSATYLYLDKSMQDHGLFQAICRVNRLDGDSKDYGYVIDYKDLFNSVKDAIKDYTSEAFDKYDKEDVEGLLLNRLTKGKERLEEVLESVRQLCQDVEHPRDLNSFIAYFMGEDLQKNSKKRQTLYTLVASLIRAYANIANEMSEIGYSDAQIIAIKDEVTHYTKMRDEIKIASADYVDLKAYEPAMRQLIDMYISAEESEVISDFMGMSLIDLIVKNGAAFIDKMPKSISSNKQASSETIDNNMRKIIIDEMPTNPAYFEKMSQLLEEIIKLRREQAIEYAEYLKQISELASNIKNGNSTEYPENIKSKGQKALFDNLDNDVELALKVDSAVKSAVLDDWRNNMIKERRVKYAIEEHVPADKVKALLNIIIQQREY